MNFRFLVTGSDQIQQYWCIEALLESYKRVGQTQPITILWACENGKKYQYLPSGGEIFLTPLYERIPSGFYQPMNRIAGVKTWLRSCYIPEEYIVVIDPDFIFLKYFDLSQWNVKPCNMVCGRDWWRDPKLYPDFMPIYKKFGQGLVIDDPKKTNIHPSMVPLCIHIEDLWCMAQDWDQYTLMYHQWLKGDWRQWTSELFAWDVLVLIHQINMFATKEIYHTPHWDQEPKAPFLHYFHDFRNLTGTWKMHKHDYRWKLPEGIRVPENINTITRIFFECIFHKFGGEFIAAQQ